MVALKKAKEVSCCNDGPEGDSQLVVNTINVDIPVPWSHRLIGGETARVFLEVLVSSEWRTL